MKKEKDLSRPKELNILGKPYKIIYVEKPCDVDPQGRASYWGMFDPWERTIKVYDNKMVIEDVWHTIIHEVLHGISIGLKIDMEATEQGHEELDLIAMALTDFLFRNDLIKLKE